MRVCLAVEAFPFACLVRDLNEYIDLPIVLIHDSPYKIVHSVFLIDGFFRCKLQAFPESTTCVNPV